MLTKIRMQRESDKRVILWSFTSAAIAYIITLNYIIKYGL